MNLYGLIVLCTLLFDQFLKWLGDWLNLGALRTDLPEELRGTYDAESYEKSQHYTRDRTLFGYLTSVFDLLALLIFWFLGGFAALDELLRGFGLGPVVTGLLFIATLVIGKGLLSLPFALYSTFVIEERYGFNRTTLGTFFLDMIKSLVLGVVMGGPFLAVLLWLFESVGPDAWLYCWIATSAYTLFVQYVFPTWILPIFNKFEPLEEGELRQALDEYAQSVGFQLSGIFVMDGSRRSSRSNAFFTGMGRNKRIALFDTLIEKQTVPELVAVLAHEVGHYRRKHIPKMMLLGILHSGIMFFLLSRFLEHRGLFDAFFVQETSVYCGLIFFGLLYSPIELVLTLLIHTVERKHEFEADRFAAETIAEPDAMATALEKLSSSNLSNLTPHPFYVFLNHSHPPMLQRVAAIRALP